MCAVKRMGQNRKGYYAKSQTLAVNRFRPLPTWSKETLLAVAADRGYQTENGLVHALGEALTLSRSVVKRLLSTGRWRWEQILVIGSFLEMSPKEFADVFLHDFFVETDLGEYICHIDNYTMVLDPPKTKDGWTKADRAEAERERIAYDLDHL